jgi:hypothetical protein
MTGTFWASPLHCLPSTPRTIVAVSCSDADLEEEADDTLADELQGRGITVVAPEAIDVTTMERLTVEAHRWFGGGMIDMSYVATIVRHFNADRALLANLDLSVASLPYGDFTVYSVNASCSYRCFQVSNKTIVAAGSFSAEARGEELQRVERDAALGAVSKLAHSAASRLR